MTLYPKASYRNVEMHDLKEQVGGGASGGRIPVVYQRQVRGRIPVVYLRQGRDRH